MSDAAFVKAASTPEQLLAKLEGRGMAVTAAQRAQALAYLRFVGGYRLKGYWFHAIDPATQRFPSGYTLDDLVQRCELDRQLRAATGAAIDRLEVAIRTAMANYMSLAHSPHWFLDTQLFKPTRRQGVGRFIKKIEDEVDRAREKRFVSHYFSRYGEPYLPPSWVVSECVSFGLWSHTYSILRHPKDKKAIAKKFGIEQAEVFESWIHTLTVVRNITAHHGQLLRVPLRVAPANYKNLGITFSDPKSFFSAATVIQYLLAQTGLPHSWVKDLSIIFSSHPLVPLADLGFTPGWSAQPGWR